MASSTAVLSMGASFEERARLEDGGRVLLRWIRPADTSLLRDGFARLSENSRVLRFFVPLHNLSDDVVRYLTDVDGINHAALVAVSPRDDRAGVPERGFGVARFIRSEKNPKHAELAVTVTDDAQGRGLGRLLVNRLAIAARERGVETFEMSVMGMNRSVVAWLLRLGAEPRGRDGAYVEYVIPTTSIVGDDASLLAAFA